MLETLKTNMIAKPFRKFNNELFRMIAKPRLLVLDMFRGLIIKLNDTS